jgi:2-haloacid dehalogenase
MSLIVKPDIAVVLDFGGVLFKSSLTAMYAKRFAAQGRKPEDVQYFLSHIFTPAARGEANLGTMKAVTANLSAQYPDWADEIKALDPDRNFLDRIQGTVEGMPELVEFLYNQGVLIFGLTNWAADTFPVVSAAYPFLNFFNETVVSGEEGIKKPNPEIFIRAEKRYGVPGSNLFFFDDKQANIEAAWDAGWNALRFEGVHVIKAALAL